MAGAVFVVVVVVVVVVVDATDQQMAHDTQRDAVDAGALGQDSFRRRRRLCRPVARLFNSSNGVDVCKHHCWHPRGETTVSGNEALLKF